MDIAETSANSGVIIQCTDPNDLLTPFQNQLSHNLPLRNLHWKSPSRPLRSIPSLNVSLTREEPRISGTDISTRRHQIPGLRQTPYVKLYLLRCDDKETYKETCRKEVRQWVKQNIQPSNDTKNLHRNQENHDAFEWLIVHVILPDTPAAIQPRSSKHISLENTDSTDSVNSKSKWSGKTSSTIYDKLRADFDNNSKSTMTRVVQVRLVEPGKYQSGIPSSEIDDQWQEITEILKSSILQSFNSRVIQYEDDIKERDSQRKLPGWNFCTFFILKEGLAKGFESVGLLDDALTVYNELSIGLDLLSQEDHNSDYDNPSGSLLQFSRDLKRTIRSAIEPRLDVSTHEDVSTLSTTFSEILNSDIDKYPFDIEKKKYRELILSNEVSALDFRIYIFTKELEILSKLAHVTTIINKNATMKTSQCLIDLEVLSNMMERSVGFINLAARALRHDLFKAWGGQEGLKQEELYTQKVVTGNIVATWTWAAIIQILSKVFSILKFDNNWIEVLHEILQEGSMDSFTGMMTSKQEEVSFKNFDEEDEETFQKQIDLSLDLDLHIPASAKISFRDGSRRLTNWMAHLVMMSRDVFGNLEMTKHWTQIVKNIGLENYAKSSQNSKGRKVFRELKNANIIESLVSQEHLVGLDSGFLKRNATSSSLFFRSYLLLTTISYRLLEGGGNHSAAKKPLTDLSQLSYINGQYRLAVECLKTVLGPMANYENQIFELPLLIMLKHYLKLVRQPVEYLQCLLVCLRLSRIHKDMIRLSKHVIEQYCNEIIHVSNEIKVTTLPLSYLFQINSTRLTISHFEDKDGFYISLHLQSLSSINVTDLSYMKLFMNARAKQDPLQIELHSSTLIDSGKGYVIVHFQSNITTQGWYDLDRLEVKMNNLHMSHNFTQNESDQSISTDENPSKMAQMPSILIYPRANALLITVKPATTINLDKFQSLTLFVEVGDAKIDHCTIKLQGATAGLRLYIHDSVLEYDNNDSLEIRQDQQGPLIYLHDLHPRQYATIQLPYGLENLSESTINVKVEVRYKTEMGNFIYFDNCSVNIILPVAVNVQDIFKIPHTYSRFTIGPSTFVPLYLLGCTVNEDHHFKNDINHSLQKPIFIFPKQAAHWVIHLNTESITSYNIKSKLTLNVNFECLDEIILNNIQKVFQEDIANSPFHHLSRLLISHLTNQIRSSWTEQDLEITALLSEIEVWPFDDLNWNGVLCGLDKSVKHKVVIWLKSWHLNHANIKLNHSSSLQRHLTILVDLPINPLIVSTAFELGKVGMLNQIVVGQPLKVTLLIEVYQNDIESQQKEQNLEFNYEVIAQQDQWLVGGRRKGTLHSGNIPFRVEIILLPQRTGDVLLPSLDIRCRKGVRTDRSSSNDWVEIPIEVNNKTQAKSLHVITNLLSTTVEIVEQESHDSLAICRRGVQRPLIGM